MKTEKLTHYYLTEKCGFSEKEYMSLSEDSKNASLIELLKNILVVISDKASQIDTSAIDRSKGDIKLVHGINELQEAITQIETMLDRVSRPEINKKVQEACKAIVNVNKLSSVFKQAYKEKNSLLILKYQSLLFAIFSEVAYIISASIDFTDNNIKLKNASEVGTNYDVTYNSLKNFNNSVESGEFNLALKDVETVKEAFMPKGYYDNYLCEELLSDISLDEEEISVDFNADAGRKHRLVGAYFTKASKYDENNLIAGASGIIKNSLTPLIFMLIPIVGMAVGPAVSIARYYGNSERMASGKYELAKKIVKDDNNCKEILKKISNELLNKKPDGKLLKSYKKEFYAAYQEAVENYKNKNLSESATYESTLNIISTVVDGIKNFYNNISQNGNLTAALYKIAGVISVILSIREVYYVIYKMKTKFSDISNAIGSFANASKKGSNALDKVASFAKMFITDTANATSQAEIDINDENKLVSKAAKTGNISSNEIPVASQDKSSDPISDFQLDF